MTAPQFIRIKKYPNRRLYDASRSCHLTHEELYDLVVAGHTVSVTDSRSGVDITNLVLIQAILERSPEKLAAFPPELSHLLVRASEQMLRSAAHGWLSQLMASVAPLTTAAPASPLAAFGAVPPMSPIPPFPFSTPLWPTPATPTAPQDGERFGGSSTTPMEDDRTRRAAPRGVRDGSRSTSDSLNEDLATLRAEVARLSQSIASFKESRSDSQSKSASRSASKSGSQSKSASKSASKSRGRSRGGRSSRAGPR